MRQVVWIGSRLLESQMLSLHLRGSPALGVSSPELGKAGRRLPGLRTPFATEGSGTSSSCTGHRASWQNMSRPTYTKSGPRAVSRLLTVPVRGSQ